MKYTRPILFALLCLFFANGPFYAYATEDSAEFQRRLFQDWIFQDYGLQDDQCFQNPKDHKVELHLIEKALSSFPESEKGSFRKIVSEWTAKKVPGNDPRWKDLYRQICMKRRVQRLELFLDECPEIVYTKHFVLGASFYSYTDDTTDEQYHDYSRDRRPGASLCKMILRPDGSVVHETLVESKEGMIRDPEVSWDGKRILFSMRNDLTKDDFHLYEYHVESKKVRQLTFGPGFADTEPVYLPNGDILFSSTRCMQVIDCWWTEATNFYVCDQDGRFMRRISFDQVSVNYPKVAFDGRITYTRWDYNDRGQIFPQPLFIMNPDGTGQTEFYGNNSWFPTTILHARGIPGSHKVLAIASGHHTYQHGKLIQIDRTKGTQEADGITYVSPVQKADPVRIDQFGQNGEQFQYPYPLSETEWLVSYLPEGRKFTKKSRQYEIPFGVYAMDLDGNRELLAWDPTISCNQQIPLKERPLPVLRPSSVDENLKTGRFYVHNVYEGPGLKGIPKGTIKSLRVVSIETRSAGIGSNVNFGEGGGALVSTPIAISNGSWDVKHVLGSVPIEKDGSAFFEVPAKTPLYFQLLDKNDDVVQTMRSWSTLQPGEFFACIGCHEAKENTTNNPEMGTSIAISKPPQKPKPVYTPPKGIIQNTGFSFVRDIQPIFDTHCVECHTGEKNPDGSPAPFSLMGNEVFSNAPTVHYTEIPRDQRWLSSKRRFSESYLNLTNYGNRSKAQYINWLDVQSAPPMLLPYTSGAFKSPIVQMFRTSDRDKNHKNVKISESEIRRIALWIDLLVPFCGDYLEENKWTPQEMAEYAYYEMKKTKMAEIVEKNIELKQKYDRKEIALPAPESFERFQNGGPEEKKKFISAYLSKEWPDWGYKTGKENIYRNLALNPKDVQGEKTSWPHASSNSEYARRDCFAAKNAIDGITKNTGHGENWPSWGPNKRTDLSLKVEFGHKVRTDKVVLWLRADFPHDEIWTSATLEFSDGSKERITLKKTDKPQSFTFSERETQYVRLTDLVTTRPLGWCGITEMEIWGRSVEK